MGVTVRQKNKAPGAPWWVFIHHKGKRKSIKVGDKKAAKRLAAKIEFKLKAGEAGLLERQSPTFGELAAEWVETVAPATCKETTAEWYAGILRNHVLPRVCPPPCGQHHSEAGQDFLDGQVE